MKLKIGDKVYLQKYEAVKILRGLNELPGCILRETFSGVDGLFFMDGPMDVFRFECVYSDPKSVEWLMAQDWIVDYDEYIEVPLAELEVLQKRVLAECSDGISEFNAKDVHYREAHIGEVNDKYEKLRHKIISLGDLIRFRKGEIDFVFPAEYRCEATTSDTPDAASAQRRKPGFFARLFGRSVQ